jgi:hypothetical protein
MNNNRMPKIMLNYRPNQRRRLGRPWKRLLAEAETGLLRRNSNKMMMISDLNSFLLVAWRIFLLCEICGTHRVLLKNRIFWNVMSCRLVKSYRRFQGRSSLFFRVRQYYKTAWLTAWLGSLRQ